MSNRGDALAAFLNARQLTRVKEPTPRLGLKPLHTSEPVGEDVAARVVVAAIGTARDAGAVAPTAAAVHTDTQCPDDRSAWIRSAQVRAAGRIRRRRIPVPTPLQHIARHVIQTIPVRRKRSHRTREGVRSLIEGAVVTVRGQIKALKGGCPAVAGLMVCAENAPWKTAAGRGAPRCLFPLCFRRQPTAVGRPVGINREAMLAIGV